MAEARRSERAAIKAAKAEARQHARVERLRLKPWRAPGLTSGERFAIRYRLDPDYCIRQRLRAAFRRKRQGIKLGDLLRCAIKRAGRSPRAEAFLGYTVPDLRRHLDRQFRDGMDWARFCAGEIHIDHILPLAGFDLADPDELRAAWALPNLRPAWAVDNRTKAARRTHLL
ncbi:hypothetical protein [Methylobacterium sp. CCH5-D2]|uniref:hypothetical protein n=1 Tax=Methylobacterium sp. CCH5-D2 TaxID=1768765 RepID=UPI000836624E|nr:hypothetical protein [Methylobacterium sp. CCH5-D2]